MLLVIFGAGASFDSVPSRPPTGPNDRQFRPPLANDLFADRPLFVDVMTKVPRCLAVVPYLQRFAPNLTLEQTLEKLQSEAAEHAERHRQLAAIRFYLHFMLFACQSHWMRDDAKGATNYITLLDQIDHWHKHGDQVSLVTFNYDTMLELAMRPRKIQDFSDYIDSRQRFGIYKVHGSINWARKVQTPIEYMGDGWAEVNRLIDLAPELDITNNWCILADAEDAIRARPALYPALAIPVETKKAFEFPDDHLAKLKEVLPKVTQLLLIGWRATEGHFLKLLKDHLKKPVRAMVVAGAKQFAQETIAKLNDAGIGGDHIPARSGFTDFVVMREGENFLRGQS